jgi:hypothetical protein
MPLIGTKKLGSHITNLHIKRPRMTVIWKIGSIKIDDSQSQIKRSHITRFACTAEFAHSLYLSKKYHSSCTLTEKNEFYSIVTLRFRG